MKLTEISNEEKQAIFEVHPEWLAIYDPEWVLSNNNGWLWNYSRELTADMDIREAIVRDIEWAFAYDPVAVAEKRPLWVANTHSKWMSAHKPEWMAANTPGKLFETSRTAAWAYASEWVLDNKPEWAVKHRRAEVEVRKPELIPKPIDVPDYITKIVENKRREEK